MTQNTGQYTTRITDAFLRHSDMPTQDVLTKVLLFDFETGGSDILPQHDHAIQRYVLPYIGRNVKVWIAGTSSRLGNETGYNNQGLSTLRAQAAARRITFRAPQVLEGMNCLTVRSLGSTYSGSGSANAPYHRAVLVVVARANEIPEPSRQPPPRQLPFFNRFRIRLIAGLEGGEILVAGAYQFAIDYDVGYPHCPPSNEVRYKLYGGGGGIGLPAGITAGGDWNSFNARRNCTPSMFGGRASIGGVNIGLAGETTLNLFPSRGNEIVVHDFQSGLSGNLGISRIYGPFSVDNR